MTSGRQAGFNGNKPRQEYNDNGSIVGYIPDDVSSVHSSALGGVGVPSNYPPMFSNFQESWPLPGRPNGKGKNGAPQSVAGESVAASELTDTRSDAPGGISLSGLSLNDYNKPTSLSQSDRLNRYVENTRQGPNVGTGFGAGRGLPRGLGGFEDDDARSVSTAFASQIGTGNNGYD
jgi:regulator of nonsense transcripts 1